MEAGLFSIMPSKFNRPPKSKELLTPSDIIVEHLRELVGKPFSLTNRTRTDGSRIRKLVAHTLEKYPLPSQAEEYTIVNKKGLPGILLEYLDTYIITSGEKSYNLQVWNRNPSSNSVQIEFPTGNPLSANDVRFVFVRVEPIQQYIRSILVLTPEYITNKFGPYGKPTTKYQLIIAPKTRQQVIHQNPPYLFYPDTPQFAQNVTHTDRISLRSMKSPPIRGEVMSLEVLRDKLIPRLIGFRLDAAATKNRGQALEQLVAQCLGYVPMPGELLEAQYPDIPNQVLEVKVQDSPTVDLGRFSPEFNETLPSCTWATTRDVRYLIALTDSNTGIIKGLILCPGAKLGDHFSYVADQNYKCQRSIPMSFFNTYDNQALFNPGGNTITTSYIREPAQQLHKPIQKRFW